MWAVGGSLPVPTLLSEEGLVGTGYPLSHNIFLNVLLQACYFSRPFVWYEEPIVIEPEKNIILL